VGSCTPCGLQLCAFCEWLNNGKTLAHSRSNLETKCLIVALAALASTAAFAQSSVTIDGAIELSMVKATGKSATLDATNGASQIRFLGTEDLGGGMKANFVLAQRFSPESGLADGTNGTRPLFQGETTVGLSGGFGAVKIGRALTAFQGPVNSTDPYGTLKQGSTAALATGYATDIDNSSTPAASGSGAGRTDAIFFNSATYNGFNAAVSYGLKNSTSSGTNTVGANNLTSFWASYSNGPVMVGGGAEKNRTGDKINAILGTYDLGVVKLGAGSSTVDKVATAGSKGKTANLMAIVPMGAATFTLGCYGQAKADNAAAAATKKTGLGVDYAMSKRTTLYTSYGRDAALAADKTGFDFGIRHSF